MIEIIPAQDEKIKTVLNDLESYNWMFFTSRNGVLHFFKHMLDERGNTELPEGIRIATIGYKTAIELDYYGYAPNLISEGNTSADLLNHFFNEKDSKDQKILLSLVNLADDTLSKHLLVNNEVQRINVYETVKPKQADPEIISRIEKDLYDLIIFTSPSTFFHFCSFYGIDRIGKLRMASIGSVTTKAIREAGFEPILTAKKSNTEGLRDELVEYYKSH